MPATSEQTLTSLGNVHEQLVMSYLTRRNRLAPSMSSGSVRIAAVIVSGALTLSLMPAGYTSTSWSQRSCEQLCSAVPTVKRWLRHLEQGNSRSAWQLMTKQSRDAIGGFEQFKEESSAWAEGWGAWAEASNRSFELRVIAPKDGDADSVVTMTGRVPQEGPYRRSAAALPVMTRDNVTKVDPMHGKARVIPKRPTWGQTIRSRPRFEATVRRIRGGYNSVYFVVKGSKVEPQRAKLEKTGRRSYRAALRWPRRLTAGPHVVTIASWGRDGHKAVAVRFQTRHLGAEDLRVKPEAD